MSFFKRIFSSEKKDESLNEQEKQSLDKGLEKSKTTFFSKLSKAVVGKSKVDDEVLDNLESKNRFYFRRVNIKNKKATSD